MISKSLLKLIHSLEIKKYRRDTGLFVAEGGKCVGDIINSGIACEKIIATDKWLSENRLKTSAEIIAVSDEDLQKASFLRAPQGVIGLFKQPAHTIDPSIAESYALHWTRYRTRAISAQLYALPIGSALRIFSVHRILPIYIIQKPYNRQWEL